jgi:hypothetical protein
MNNKRMGRRKSILVIQDKFSLLFPAVWLLILCLLSNEHDFLLLLFRATVRITLLNCGLTHMVPIPQRRGSIIIRRRGHFSLSFLILQQSPRIYVSRHSTIIQDRRLKGKGQKDERRSQAF